MILDNFAFLSGAVSAAGVLSGQLLTANSTLSTNTYDTGSQALGGNQPADLGVGEPLTVEFSILAAPTAVTAVQFQLIQADDAALTSNVQVIDQTDAIAIATLAVGVTVALGYDRAAPLAPKRYIGARYIASGGTTLATMSVVASIVKNYQDKQTSFKNGFAVL